MFGVGDNGPGGDRRGIAWGRLRLPTLWAAALLVVANAFFDVLPGPLAIGLFFVALAFYLRLAWPPRRDAVQIEPPVQGRWRALNSPADRVPSHGMHAYGQTWAIDLIGEPADGGRPRMGWWPLARRPESFPGFGAEVRAPLSGTVVRVHDRERDHWSRNSWPALAFVFVEGALRELTGPNRILGNNVVIDAGDGVYAALAHLQRDSVAVRPGDSVTAGEMVGRCGNSGNSSEPHLHMQLMDHSRPFLADGIPFALNGLGPNGEPAVPGKAEPFTA